MLLIAERDPKFAAKFKKHLKIKGLRNFFVETLRDGLYLLKSMPAHFILVNLNSLASAEELAQLEQYAKRTETPCLFIEGSKSGKVFSQQLRARGNVPIMTLPFTISDLKKKIYETHKGKDPLIGVKMGPKGQEVELLRKLGSGAMGHVYEAHQPSLDRRVAVKLLSPDLQARDKEAVARFSNEARAMAAMRSPHVVQVYSVGDFKGHSYLIMEYIDGPNLEKYLRSKKALKIREALRICRQILDGLAEAHRRGRIHRDLKPANVMINREGQAVILDFGLVRETDDQKLTRAGTVLGTPRYIPPEQVRGGVIDHRSDLYSLGVILFEMLMGRPPFQSDDFVGVLMKHCNEPLPSPESLGKSLPPGLFHIIETLAAKNPEDRYPTAEAAVEVIDRFMVGLEGAGSLSSDSGALAVKEALQPLGGMAINESGAMIQRFGAMPEDRDQTLHLVRNLIAQIQDVSDMGEFERGCLAADGGSSLLVFSAFGSIAGIETRKSDAESKFEKLELEDLPKIFQGSSL